MEDREFINEAINRLIPHSEWHGESNSDNESLKNIDIQYDALEIVLDRLFTNIVIPGQEGNWSAEAIKKKKREKLLWLIDYLDDLPELVGYKLVKIEKEKE